MEPGGDGAVFEDPARGRTLQVEVFHGEEGRFGPHRSESFAAELREGEDEIGDGVVVSDIEEMDVEVEGRSGRDDSAIEVAGAEDEGTGMVGEPARSGAFRHGLKDSPVDGCFSPLAGELVEDGAESAAQNVSGLPRREVNRAFGAEMEAETMKKKLHARVRAAGPTLPWRTVPDSPRRNRG